MKILGASVVFICDREFRIIPNGGVAYENGLIVGVGDYDELLAQARIKSKKDGDDCDRKREVSAEFFHDCVLMPALINAHIHFEFSGNTTSFDYGSFPAWLTSVMAHREEVLDSMQEVIESTIATQFDCGVGSVGAISSYGGDMQALANSGLKVVYCNEAIGSNPAAIDMLFADFKERFYASSKLAHKRFFPAIALHAPYSVHSVLAKHIIAFANDVFKEKGEQAKQARNPCEHTCTISAHFLESSAERTWLKSLESQSSVDKGWFYEFYTHTLKIPNPKPYYTIDSFMELFEGTRAVFTHGTKLTKEESSKLVEYGFSLITCPRSNRLLDGEMLRLSKLDTRLCDRLGIGTDGASSNANTNMLDELRAGLFGMEYDLRALARILLLSATNGNAGALGLYNGVLERGRSADIAVFAIPNIAQSRQPEVHFITLAQKVHRLFIDGEQIR